MEKTNEDDDVTPDSPEYEDSKEMESGANIELANAQEFKINQGDDNVTTQYESEIDQNAQSPHAPSSPLKRKTFQEDGEHAISFKNLSYSINQYSFKGRTQKTIVNNVSGYIPSQCLCGIIGQSGAGKTTLLGLLAGIPKSGNKTGDVSVISKKIVFVSQIPHMALTETVSEILTFAANVTYQGDNHNKNHKTQNSISDSNSVSEHSSNRWDIIKKQVSQVIDTLNLSKVRSTQVRYLSGGEKKRLSIAMQLMSYPDILICDEPTSGLDTPSALSLIQTLRNVISNHKCSIVMSIHQPHKRICDCMDWIISLRNGNITYQGTLSNAFECRNGLLNDMISKLNSNDINVIDKDNAYFDKMIVKQLCILYNLDHNKLNNDNIQSLIKELIQDGVKTQNAADYLLETQYLCKTDKLCDEWLKFRNQIFPDFENEIDNSLKAHDTIKHHILGINCNEYLRSFLSLQSYISSFWAFIGLLLRTFRLYFRQFWLIAMNIIISAVAAFILGSIYGDMSCDVTADGLEDDNGDPAMLCDQTGIQNRFGAIGFTCIFIGIQAIASSGAFHESRDVFIDDRNAKLYNATPYLFARSIPDLLLLRIIPAMIFAKIFFDMIGFQEDTWSEFLLVVTLFAIVSSVCVFAISTLSPSAYMAGFVAIFFNMFLMLYGGVFIQDDSAIPSWLEWPKEISFYNFAFEILMVNEFEGLNFLIEDATVNVNGLDISTDSLEVSMTGDFFVEEYFGCDPDDIDWDYQMLVTWIIIYFLIAYLSLEFLYRSKR